MNLLPNFLIKIFRRKAESDKYETFVLNTSPMSKEQKELLKRCKRVLIDNKVSLNKIRFVFEPSFTYDIDKDIINPIYRQLVPKNKKSPIIEIGVPRNVMKIYLGEYCALDNFFILKGMLKKTKVGVVVLVTEIDYYDTIYIANLDDAVTYYKLNSDDYDT